MLLGIGMVCGLAHISVPHRCNAVLQKSQAGQYAFDQLLQAGNSHCCRARATADAVTDEVQKNGVELVLHVGDISYANGDPEASLSTSSTACQCVKPSRCLCQC